MGRQTLRDWVHRYDEEGLAGLADRPLRGRTPMLRFEQRSELAAIIETGPDPERDGVVRWRRIDLCAVVERRFAVRVAEQAMGSILRRLGFAKLSARPRHPRSDPEAQELYVCCDAWNALLASPERVASITSRRWARVSG